MRDALSVPYGNPSSQVQLPQMAINVENLPTILTPFRESLFVVCCNMMLNSLLLPRGAVLLAKLTVKDRHFEQVEFNLKRLHTLYIVSFTSQTLAPVLSTIVFDENCLR